jgi:hypothetical protein
LCQVPTVDDRDDVFEELVVLVEAVPFVQPSADLAISEGVNREHANATPVRRCEILLAQSTRSSASSCVTCDSPPSTAWRRLDLADCKTDVEPVGMQNRMRSSRVAIESSLSKNAANAAVEHPPLICAIGRRNRRPDHSAVWADPARTTLAVTHQRDARWIDVIAEAAIRISNATGIYRRRRNDRARSAPTNCPDLISAMPREISASSLVSSSIGSSPSCTTTVSRALRAASPV